MTKQELIAKLKQIAHEHEGDPEVAHIEADNALLKYINDIEIGAAYDAIGKWYA